jgi:hypothetical protein
MVGLTYRSVATLAVVETISFLAARLAIAKTRVRATRTLCSAISSRAARIADLRDAN